MKSPTPYLSTWAAALLLVFAAACSSDDQDPKNPPPEPCDSGLTRCGDDCVDLLGDPSHCGACGKACDDGQSCVEGTCVLDCPEGRIECDGSCVDPQSDPLHCGACDQSCEEGEVCSEGACAGTCAEGLEDCDGSCVDLQSNDAHCGACGESCDEGLQCDGGACVCPDGGTLCDGKCVDTQSDTSHCGACGTACREDEVCSGGACACPEGLSDCEGRCVDTASDAAHCGACGESCDEGEACENSLCTCPVGKAYCEGSCISILDDPANCGECGTVCPEDPSIGTAICTDGECGFACKEGSAECDGNPASICETDIWTNPQHCGACGQACRGDEVCSGGTCTCPAGTKDCDGVCTPVLANPEHCGACGVTCQANEVCEQGICCDADKTICGGACVDTRTETEHCGACNFSCLHRPDSTGGLCVDATCELSCEDDRGDCNDDPVDGCETDLLADAQHCGACGNACPVACEDGACVFVETLSTRIDHNCVILSNGEVRCWGYNAYGQLGDGTTTNQAVPVRVQDPSDPSGFLTNVRQMVQGFGHTCALLQDSSVKCWGWAGKDENDLNIIHPYPLPVPDPQGVGGVLHDVASLSSGRNFVCAAMTDQTVKCWGWNDFQQLGDGSASEVIRHEAGHVLEPSDPTGKLTGVVAVYAGTYHACALKQDSTVWCWGDYRNGKLGIPGLTEQPNHPVRVLDRANPFDEDDDTPLSGVVELALGQDHTCALIQDATRDGIVKCWGRNNSYNLGDGTNIERDFPRQVNDVEKARQISASTSHTCARLEDQTAICWGSNTSGRLGGGTTTSSVRWTRVNLDGEPMEGIVHIGAGNAGTCALRTDGQVLCWGRNNFSQLGDPVPASAGRPAPGPVVWIAPPTP